MSATAIEDDPMLTVDDVARHLKTTRHAIYMRRRRGAAPPFFRSGAKLVIRQSVYTAWLDEQAKAQD